MKKINKYLIFSFLLAFIILLITSKNSFLYVFNDWVDANSFFTVGKSMFNGIVPYKDLFEQKGPLLYLIYGIGYLISNKSFHGVFLLEVISFGIFLYYIHKIFVMFFDKKYSLVLLPALSMLMTGSLFFVHGGSCEEFCLPFFAVSLYYYFKHFKERKLSNKEILINGLMAGLVLMMKYTLLGFWIAFCIFIGVNYLYKKEIKKTFIFFGLFLIGMVIPFLLGLVYFAINNGVKEFINVYFILNITLYADGEKFGIFRNILEVFKYIFAVLKELKPFGILLSLSFILSFFSKKDRLFRLSLIGLSFMTLFFMAWGLKMYIYYYLPVFVLTIIFLELFSTEFFKKIIDKIINKKIAISLYVLFCIIILIMTYKFANYKEYMKMTKDDFVQYKYAKYINKYKDPTLLNMGFLDIGVYTTTGIVPNTRFFEVHNFSYNKFKDNIDEMEKYVNNKQVKFIVYSVYDSIGEPPSYIYENYKEIYKDNYVFEKHNFTSYLFKLNEIVE